MVELKTVLWINIILFGAVFVLHLLRVILGWELTLGSWMAPLWLSVVALLVTGTLAILNWKHTK